MSDSGEVPVNSQGQATGTLPNPAATPAPAPTPAPASTTGTRPDGGTATALTGDEQQTEAAATEVLPVDLAALKFPEGFDKPNEALLGRFGEVSKSLKLSQEGAQQLTDLYSDAIKSASEANMQAWKVTIDAWEKEIREDPQIGGDKLKAIQTSFHKVLSNPRFATPGVVEALMLTGAGSNPAINRFMAKIVAALTEGTSVEGSPGARQNGPRSAAQALYPNLPSSSESG